MNPLTPSLRDWQTIKRGARTNFLGITLRTLRAAYLVFVARIFGSEILGYFLLAWGLIEVASKLGLFGMDRAVLRFVPPRGSIPVEERRKIVLSALGLTLFASLVTSTVLYLFSTTLATHVLDQPHLLPAFRIMSWAVVPLAVSSVLLALTRIERHMQYKVWVRSLVEPALLLGLALWFWTLGQQAVGLYLAQLLSLIGGFLLSIVFVGRLDRDLWRDSPEQSEQGRLPNVSKFLSQLAVFSLPIALYDLLAMAAMRLDLFLLAPHVTAQELGIYGAAAQTAFLVKKIRQSFEPIYAPVLADQLRSKDTHTLRHNLQNVTLWISAFSFGFLLLVALVGKEILLIFGPEFGRGSTVLLLLSWAYAINGFWGVTENLVLLKKPYWNLCNWMVSICLGAVLCLVLIPSYHLTGAALAIATVFTFLNLLRLWQTYRLVRIHPFSSDSGLVVFSAVALGTCAFFLLQAGPVTVLFRLTIALLTVALYGGAVFGVFKRR